MELIKTNSPHIRRKDSLSIMMLDVLIALLPVVIFSFAVFKLYALRNILVSVATMVLCEFIYVLIVNRIPYDGEKHSLLDHLKKGIKAYHLNNFLVPTVSAIIYAMIMPCDTENPSSMIYWALISGAIFGMVIGKLVFGGTGKNIFNPAGIGMMFAKICFGSYFVTLDPYYSQESLSGTGASFSDISNEIVAGSTPLDTSYTYMDGSTAVSTLNLGNYSMLDLFLGKIPGLMGEVCKLAILIGLVYLIIRHTIDWRIPASYIGGFALIMLFAGITYYMAGVFNPSDLSHLNPFYYMMYQLLSGGLLFGAVYMATDPVTSPTTGPGRVMYGFTLAAITALLRLFGSTNEGVIYSIVIGNMLTPLFDYYKWSSRKWTVKKIIAASSIFVCSVLIVVWALCVKEF